MCAADGIDIPSRVLLSRLGNISVEISHFVPLRRLKRVLEASACELSFSVQRLPTSAPVGPVPFWGRQSHRKEELRN